MPANRVSRIEYRSVPVGELALFSGNPRRGDVDRIAESLSARGQYRPIVVNAGTVTGRSMEVLAGNHTLMAARQLGWDTIDCGVIDVDDTTAKAIVAADNRLADLGGYDEQSLADLLQDVGDLAGTGYTDEDLDALLKDLEVPAENTDPDDAPEIPEENPVTVEGDVWELGPHRLYCGDSTMTDPVMDHLMGDGLADCVWTDPPYGVEYVGKTKSSLTIKNDTSAGLHDLLDGAFGMLIAATKPGAAVYVAHADTNRVVFQEALQAAGVIFRQNLIWVKNSIALGHSDYHYQHEPILYATTPDFSESPESDAAATPPPVDPAAPYNADHQPLLYGYTPGAAGRRGRSGEGWYGDNGQSTVFNVPRPQRNSVHPTMKPVDLIRPMLHNSCPPGGIVLDLFGGSGSTLIACHHEKMRARLVELDPRYCDVICRRFQEHTGIVPLRRAGDTVEEVSFL
ncbi:DNA methyltransferase [Corynebacterium pyruviciproducens]|uniref:DNA methyltransferase n=1 Tax=Corynebacterium pyruviciproducens TaxID=598660 RepID=UPI002551119B|nr:DNA methyltransferase [Corynebacterium pyruviciproducens]MDK7213412.1 DNA methyltransferase [Corynebacterium pyruviciproducens]